MQDRNKFTFCFVISRKDRTFAPRMLKTVQACGFDLLFIYKHLI